MPKYLERRSNGVTVTNEIDVGSIGNEVDVALTDNLVIVSASTDRIGGTYDVAGRIIDEVPTARAVGRIYISTSSSGSTEVVAAQGAGVRVRVLAVVLHTTLANDITFKSDASDISAVIPLGANGFFAIPYCQHGWFQTAANEALNVDLSASTATGVNVIWVQST